MTPLPSRATAGWRDFWFQQIPPHSYALLRIAIGLVGLLTLAGVWDAAFWRVEGLAPPPGGGLGVRQWLVTNEVDAAVGWLARVLLLVAYACLAAGIRSNASALAAFVGSGAMLWWNWYPFSAAQYLLHNLTFYLVWVDSGSVWSWDRWQRGRAGSQAPPRLQPIWPLRLLRYQVAIMYFAAGVWKLGNEDWRAGTALYYVLNNATFQRAPGLPPAGLLDIGIALTYATLLWELLFPFALWFRPARVLALGTGVALHLGMLVTLEIGAFSYTVLAAYLAFLDPHRTKARVRRVAGWLRLERRAARGLSPVATSAPSPRRASHAS